ncbi:MAG: nodulation protein NfeD [Candidatus Hydrogenedentota bacterium]|nr:MAG: nodulation protein NfeD [Candidatus Hydrogenedentota bacterium]
MRKSSFLLILTLIIPLTVLSVNAGAGLVRVITIDDDIINPVAAEYISQAVAEAEEDGAECLIIRLDTPGGLLASTRIIVKELLNADVPTVVYVAPSGARAGSAGVFITLASNIAAMAPSTNIGAAHPVDLGGEGESWRKAIKDLEKKLQEMERQQKRARPKEGEPEPQAEGEEPSPEGEEAEQEEESTGSTMGDKVLKDTIAWTRGIARVRGRNEEWAVEAVTKSVSITETEALEKNVIDLICKDLEELLEKIDGREVQLPSGSVTLQTREARIEYHEMNTRQKILNTISNPNIAYILMMLGFFGLLFEVTHPGVGFPGIAGVICLILAFYSFQTLPVNYAGVLLILLALVLFVAEAKVTSYGLLTIGGLVCMTLGSIMLIDTPYDFLKVSNNVIFPVVFTTAAIAVFLVTLIIRAHSRKSLAGQEGLVGLIGTAETDISPEGKVYVHGEIWNARSTSSINKGTRVKVVSVDGMTIVVESSREG